MSKAYSSKALPAGTVLREWRLEEVLGVGGFGIVYKGRGIYFDELVAIKEYFPSAISDRRDGDTVVPIDSEAEEVHALGLKKFVEEAKLLWNLSTPSRHPNIVSVRSLFEIHGTAYMVMDFEDGVSLSKLLKQGQRFNQASLLALLKPIAEGLERAHRVGVLHRDIKPGNILINADGRPVLIDFGSARFESGEATSTKVTFHTPPYAAIEQYVKTYEQGPWTDIYAFGVVLYECITGTKPPEVLERMHGGLGTLLADGEHPGYSADFLQVVDAAMIVKPSERPQSISEWLALFEPSTASAMNDPDEDDDATRFVNFDTLAERIVPVAPPPPGFDRLEAVETRVPEAVAEARFELHGGVTDAGLKVSPEAVAKAPETSGDVAASKPPGNDGPAPSKQSRTGRNTKTSSPSARQARSNMAPVILAGALALAGAGLGGWWLLPKDGSQSPGAADTPAQSASVGEVVVAQDAAIASADASQPTSGDLGPALQALAAEAKRANAPGAALQRLSAAGANLLALPIEQRSGAEAATLVIRATNAFTGALAADIETRSQQIARVSPWADPRRAGAASSQGAARNALQRQLAQARSSVASNAAAISRTDQPGVGITKAREALAAWRSFAANQYRSRTLPAAQATIEPERLTNLPKAPATQVAAAQAAEDRGAATAKKQRFTAIESESRSIASRVIAMARVARPGSSASDEERERYQTLQQNKSSAEGYVKYLNTLERSMRGVKTDREADVLIAQAEQTRSYLTVLQSRSTYAAR